MRWGKGAPGAVPWSAREAERWASREIENELGWTLQPAGATFDPPIEIEFPNIAALAPAAIMYFLSFNHDTGRFEIVATGHVTDDGAAMVTDPGSGISTAGWGGFCPPYPNTGTVRGTPAKIDQEWIQ